MDLLTKYYLPQKKKPEEDEDPDEKEEGKEPEEDGEGDEDEKKKKFPFQNAYAYSRKSVADSFLNKVTDKAPETVPVDQLRKRLDLLKR